MRYEACCNKCSLDHFIQNSIYLITHFIDRCEFYISMSNESFMLNNLPTFLLYKIPELIYSDELVVYIVKRCANEKI